MLAAAFVALLAGCGSGGATFDATGTWIGTLDVLGSARPITLQLHQRPDGHLLGHVLGGTDFRVVRDGQVVGSSMEVRLQFRDPGLTREVTLAGFGVGDLFSGTADLGAGPIPFTMTRTGEVLHERRFVFAILDAMDEATAIVDLAVVLDGTGALVSGGFAGIENCDLWACGGGVTSFSEVGDDLTIGLETSGGCSAGSLVTATFDPITLRYDGTYTFTDCVGTAMGDVAGARSTRTRTDHVASILAALGRIADDFAADTGFSAPHASFDPAYLHYGRTLGEILAGFNGELATYDSIQAQFWVRRVGTVLDASALPDLLPPSTILLEQFRTGVSGGGPLPVTYVDTQVVPLDDGLLWWTETPAGWVITGNQLPPLDFPFSYTLSTTRLHVPTPGGTVYVSLGPFGAHFQPLTGHAYGDAKMNLAGFLAQDGSDLTELVGDGDSAREPGETWGFFGGATGDAIRDRIPLYIAPAAAEVTSVTYLSDPTGAYFDDVPHWQVDLEFPGGTEMRIGHLGRIAPLLRGLILAETGTDTDIFAGPAGTEVLGGATIAVAAGDALAYPQVFADPIPGFAGYHRGGGTFGDVPWAQMEFFFRAPFGSEDSDACFTQYLASTTRVALQGILEADMADSTSFRYEHFQAERWAWAAEGRLCLAPHVLPRDFSGLYTSLGGWFERDLPATTSDELFGWAPIAQDVAPYDATLYDSPAVSVLVTRRQPNGLGPFSWLMPDGSMAHPFYPVGEVLEHDGSSAFLVKWRDIGYEPGGVSTPVYQRASYILDENGLKIRWGDFAATPAGAAAPLLAPADPCNDTDTLCYDHQFQTGF